MDQTLSTYDEATLAPDPKVDPRGALHVGLWIAQGVLAVVFFLAGAYKISQPISALASSLPWVDQMPTWLVRFIGAAELAGAVGLIAPAALRIVPILSGVAAAGLATIMILATGFHAARGEWRALPVTIILGGIASFIAWGRTMEAPIPAEEA